MQVKNDQKNINRKYKKVLVLMGGFSGERDVSLETGDFFYQTTKEIGYEVSKYDLTDIIEFIDYIKFNRPDVIINALHGNYGEDGNIQGVLNLLKIPYTHCGVFTSALCMNKFMTRSLLKCINIACPDSCLIQVSDLKKQEPIKRPFVVKPNNSGSSLRVHLVFENSNLEDILDDFQNNDMILVEEYIKGKDLTIGVCNGKMIDITEIVTMGGFYDYEAKYGIVRHAEHIIPAKIPNCIRLQLKKEVEEAYKLIQANGVVRFDYLYDTENMKNYLLEINSQPGMTKISLVPEQVKHAGINYNDFIDGIIQGAILE